MKKREIIDYLKISLEPKIPVINEGFVFTKKDIEFLRNYKKSEISPFITGSDKSGFKYKAYFDCIVCNKQSSDLFSKTRLLDSVIYKSKVTKESDITCSDCLKIAKKVKAKVYEENEEIREAHRQHNTERFIELYLNPQNSFNKESKTYEIFEEVFAYFRYNNTDIQAIKSHACKMDYKDFLATPYWTAVRKQVMKKSNYKCSLCASKGKLNIHHKTYENRGLEIINLQDLICLCESCHTHFHNK